MIFSRVTVLDLFDSEFRIFSLFFYILVWCAVWNEPLLVFNTSLFSQWKLSNNNNNNKNESTVKKKRNSNNKLVHLLDVLYMLWQVLLTFSRMLNISFQRRRCRILVNSFIPFHKISHYAAVFDVCVATLHHISLFMRMCVDSNIECITYMWGLKRWVSKRARKITETIAWTFWGLKVEFIL